MQIHPQPSEFRNLMIRPNPGAFHPPSRSAPFFFFFPQSLTFLSFPLSAPHSSSPLISPAPLLALPSGAGAPEMDSALVCDHGEGGGLEWESGTTAADSRIIYAALL